MPAYLASDIGWITLWPLPLAALVAALIAAFFWKSLWISSAFLAMLSLGLLGITAGVLTGLSRDSAIGAVMPAVLSLVGGLALYILGLKHGDAKLVGSCVLSLSLALLAGTFWGSLLRSEAEREDIAWQDARKREEDSLARRKLQALDEVELAEFRSALGLAPIPQTATEERSQAAPPASATSSNPVKRQ
jgi:hypothetical protein